MRVAAGSAWGAARSIAQMVWRADIAFRTLFTSTVMVTGFGEARVNRM